MVSNMEPCPICQENLNYASLGDSYRATCPRCGEYAITGSAFAVLKNRTISLRQRANASGWLRENQNFSISTSNLDALFRLKTPAFHDRADKILLELEKKTGYAGEYVGVDKSWISWGWCLNEAEFRELISYLSTTTTRLDLLHRNGSDSYKITANGWEHLERIKRINIDSQQGFVAMWFDNSLQEVYNNTISQAIFDAGFKPHRVDQREHNNKIDDEIIAEIRRSRFVLADFTGHRGGVYFEAGFAKGLGIEVFWTCRKDDIDNLHFDIRQYNCIDWESDKLEEFKKRIAFRIESVIGHGPYQIEK